MISLSFVQTGILGVTYRLAQGVVKHIIPAVASTNAVVAAACALEVFKLASSCAPKLDNYMVFNDTDGENVSYQIFLSLPSFSFTTEEKTTYRRVIYSRVFHRNASAFSSSSFLLFCSCAANSLRVFRYFLSHLFFALFFLIRSFLPLYVRLVSFLTIFYLPFFFLFLVFRRDLHLHVRGGKEGELRGLLADPQRFGFPRKYTAERSDGTPIDDLPDEGAGRDDHRQTGPQPHALLAQR